MGNISCLPIEVQIDMVALAYSELPRVQQLCRASHALVKDKSVICRILLSRFGRMALCEAYFRHYRMLMDHPDLMTTLIHKGAFLPRFFLQYLFKRSHDEIASSLFFVESRLLEHICAHQDLAAQDDVHAFEQLSLDLLSNQDRIKELIRNHQFVPMTQFSLKTHVQVYRLGVFDEAFLELLINTGLDIVSLNDSVVHLVLANHPQLLPRFQNHGFYISTQFILAQLEAGNQEVLDMICQKVSRKRVSACALQVLDRVLGPDGHFALRVIDTILSVGRLNEAQVAKAFLVSHHLKTRIPYATRCYEQSQPMQVWSWILDRYGPNHFLSRLSLDDLITWIGEQSGYRGSLYRQITGEEPWRFVLEFLNQNATLSPLQFTRLLRTYSHPNAIQYLSQITDSMYLYMDLPRYGVQEWIVAIQALLSDRDWIQGVTVVERQKRLASPIGFTNNKSIKEGLISLLKHLERRIKGAPNRFNERVRYRSFDARFLGEDLEPVYVKDQGDPSGLFTRTKSQSSDPNGLSFESFCHLILSMIPNILLEY